MKKEKKESFLKSEKWQKLKKILCIIACIGIVGGAYYSGFSAGRKYNSAVTASADNLQEDIGTDIIRMCDLYGYTILTVDDREAGTAVVVSGTDNYAINSEVAQWYNNYTFYYSPSVNWNNNDNLTGNTIQRKNYIKVDNETADYNYGLLGQKNLFASNEVYLLQSFMDIWNAEHDYGRMYFTYYYGNICLPLFGIGEGVASQTNYPYYRYFVSTYGSNPTLDSSYISPVSSIIVTVSGDIYSTQSHLGTCTYSYSVTNPSLITFIYPFYQYIYEGIRVQFPSDKEELGYFIQNLVLDIDIEVSHYTDTENYIVRQETHTPLVNNRKTTTNNVVSWLDGNFDSLDIGKTEYLQFDGNYAGWLGKAVGGFFEVEILPGFSLGGMLLIVIAVPIVLWLLKIFAGG